MRFYAERPARAARQLLGDLVVLAWVAAVVIVARAAHDLVTGLQAPARALADAGDGVRGAFDGAARTAAGVPLVGGDLARALGTGTDAGNALGTAGRDQVAAIGTAALGVAIAVVVFAAVPVVLVWLSVRVRYARAAASAAAARAEGDDLLALRALARQPTRRLLRVSPAPATAWRTEDRDALRALAALELRSLGLRPSARRGAERNPAAVRPRSTAVDQGPGAG